MLPLQSLDAPIPADHWTHRLSPETIRMASACAQRAHQMLRDFKRENKRDDLVDPDRHLLMMDLSLVSVQRPDFSLHRLLLTSDLDFGFDLFQIAKHINRVDGTFPNDVHLRCAKKT